jgi:hypothetical protein
MSLIDSGWAAWLPNELLEAHAARLGGSAERRALRKRLAAGPSGDDRERWERFRLVCPSRIDLPADAEGLTTERANELLDELGIGGPAAEPVELVLTLDHDDLRELERLRSARDLGGEAVPEGMPDPGLVLGGGNVGRNDPCPCGSGKKFKRCHGR